MAKSASRASSAARPRALWASLRARKHCRRRAAISSVHQYTGSWRRRPPPPLGIDRHAAGFGDGGDESSRHVLRVPGRRVRVRDPRTGQPLGEGLHIQLGGAPSPSRARRASVRPVCAQVEGDGSVIAVREDLPLHLPPRHSGSERVAGKGEVDDGAALRTGEGRRVSGVQQHDVQGRERVEEGDAAGFRLAAAPLRRPGIEIARNDEGPLVLGLLHHVCQQSGKLGVGESGWSVYAEDVHVADTGPREEGEGSRWAILHRQTSADPDGSLPVGVGYPRVVWTRVFILVAHDGHVYAELSHRLAQEVLGRPAVVEVEL
ncbi:unnamed protein product [Trichogramma brassicae]|uniref:Uncharacterized protein n=1 Tax=Trichogramma brassicae TaxID=86971 RepID=A0A6H5IP85_9HYME|nr:unnamed protein product [Trichogramma brassicae]